MKAKVGTAKRGISAYRAAFALPAGAVSVGEDRWVTMRDNVLQALSHHGTVVGLFVAFYRPL